MRHIAPLITCACESHKQVVIVCNHTEVAVGIVDTYYLFSLFWLQHIIDTIMIALSFFACHPPVTGRSEESLHIFYKRVN